MILWRVILATSKNKVIGPKPLKILLDMDGVVAAFDDQVKTYLHKWGFGFDTEKYNSYSIFQFFTGMKTEDKLSTLHKMFEDDDFWLDMPVMEGAIQAVKKLNATYDVWVATKPFKMEKKYKDTKLQWLNQHFPFIPNNKVIFDFEKWNLEGSVIIDNNPEILSKCLVMDNKITIRFDNVYNRQIPTHYNLTNWKDMGSVILDIETTDRFDSYLQESV